MQILQGTAVDTGESVFNALQPKFSVCCSQGRVIVPKIVPDPDGLILRLLTGSSPESVHFRLNIRTYNTSHSFASVGAKVDPDLASRKTVFIRTESRVKWCIFLVPCSRRPNVNQDLLSYTSMTLRNRQSRGTTSTRTSWR